MKLTRQKTGSKYVGKLGKKNLPIVNRVDRMQRVVYSKARGGKHEKH